MVCGACEVRTCEVSTCEVSTCEVRTYAVTLISRSPRSRRRIPAAFPPGDGKVNHRMSGAKCYIATALILVSLACCYWCHAATGVMLLLLSCCYCRHAATGVMLLLLSCCYCCHAMQTTPFRWAGEKKSEVTMRRHTHVKSVWRTYHLGVGVTGGRDWWAWPTWGRLQTASGWCYLPVCGIGARSTPPTLNGIHFTWLHRRAIT